MCIRFFHFIFSFLLFFSFFKAQASCKDLFEGSLRSAQLISSSKADVFEKNLPKFVDIMEETKLQKLWSSKEKDPKLLSAFLPKDVSFIGHRLRESQASYVVKFPSGGSAMIARAKYESQGQSLETNITFSKEALIDNLGSEKKWLVGPRARATVLFLHGGGTKSTGGHVAEAIINHFQKHNIAVISPDLPWHAEGPRTFMGNIDQEMLSLGDLAKKYIHPDVPLFVWGHSWGGSFAHHIMQMTGEREEGFFHKSLKALIITSPALDPAPGKNLKEKKQARFKRAELARQKENERAPNEGDIFLEMVLDGKVSPTGEFFASISLAELNDKIPEHKGKNYLPSLMIVGEGDSLVYLGFEDLFHNYYDQLENVEAHYLKKLPLIMSNKEQAEPEIVGHLLSDYKGYKGENPVNFELALDFINKYTVEKPVVNKDKEAFLFDMLNIVQLWANDLAFREWSKKGIIVKSVKTEEFKRLRMEHQELQNKLLDIMYEYSPVGYLFKISETMSALEAKEKLEPLQNFFSSYASFFIFLKEKTLKESELALEKFSKQVSERSGKKYKQSFLRDLFKLIEKDSSFKELNKKYFYLSDKDIEEMKVYFQKQNNLEQKMREVYIPSFQDYKNQTDLAEQEIYQKIQKIEENVNKRLKLDEERKALIKDMALLSKEMNLGINKIKHFIKEVKLTLEETFLSPPDFLKEEFEKSEKELLELYQFSEKMAEKLEEEVLNAVEGRNFSLQSIHDHFTLHRSTIDEFNKKYDTFIQNRKKIRQTVIQAIKEGKLLPKEDHLRKELYQKIGLYSKLDEISHQLAINEAQKQKYLSQDFELIEEYNKLLPYPVISKNYRWVSIDLLNSFKFDLDFLEKNKLQLQQILKNWNTLNSQVLPSLPE